MKSSPQASIKSVFSETKRLRLRTVSKRDITDRYIEALNDPAVVGLTEARHKKWDRKSVEEYLKSSDRLGESLFIGVFLKEEDRHIGNIRLFGLHPVHRRAELGIMMFDKQVWSKGYATEALNAVVDYAFKELKLHRIHADYYATNVASARLFEKCGFKIEGVFRDHFWVKDRFVDSVRIGRCHADR